MLALNCNVRPCIMVVDECLRTAHPEAAKKIGCGVKTFQIRNHPEHETRCFMVVRTDSSFEAGPPYTSLLFSLTLS